MRSIYIPIAVCVLLAGCASPFVLMVNPKTSQSVECSGFAVGVIPAMAVKNQVENCVKQYEGLGYVKADSLTEEQRATLNVVPPSTQHKTVIEPAAIMVPAPSTRTGLNCTSNQIGSQTYTNCR
jgi:hypothetical protein